MDFGAHLPNGQVPEKMNVMGWHVANVLVAGLMSNYFRFILEAKLKHH